ncbi:hypothetical protein OPT61_g159 [Boeremia exigua]|uniref:Uncharacterized protein n=1 Tax=Boeremia exigua TaxID=749465 RepID=A0ACC2IUY8_9PLEO|nr:hypothetical protein OPT61_g159 [Boeremia exigua]
MFDKLREKAHGRDEKRPSFDGYQQQAPAPAPAYGASSSYQPPPSFQTRFASMSMHSTDDLRFLYFPPQVIDQCRNTVQGVWRGGIQRESMYGNSQEFKLSGYPWSAMGSDAMEARRLVAALLGTLHTMGWVLTLNTDVSKSPSDKDTLLFRYQSPAPAPCDWCSIAFSRSDRIRLVDSSPEVCQALQTRLGQDWVSKVSQYAPGIQEIKFHGYPWSAGGKETMRVRELLLTMLTTLEEEGWTVYASIDQSASGGDNTSETDSWHCCRLKGWVKVTSSPKHDHESAEMPRVPTALLRRARAIDPFLPALLASCRDLHAAQNELRWLREHVEKVAKVRRAKGDTLAKGALLGQLVSERANGKPLQYLIGTEFFGDLEIKCSPGVLIPRQDTAAAITHLAKLVSDASNLPDELRILDLCTGTGCIPLLFRHEIAAKRKDIDVRVVGVDISKKSMDLAHYNLRKIEKSTRARHGLTHFARADVLANPFTDLVSGAPLPVKNVLNHNRWAPFWDIITSNPPYISPSAYWKTTTRSVRAFEPRLALVPPHRLEFDDTQQGDMFYPRLLKIAEEVEAKIVLLEVADLDQALRVARLAKTTNIFDGIEIWRDDPNPSSGLSTVEDEIEVCGMGNARSVVCWRRAGGVWLGKPESSEQTQDA